MGNFFTTTQIYDKERMSKEQFIDKFCKKICDEGYVACGNVESELSYILKFADNCQWVTVMLEDYKDDMDLPRKDGVRISKMLGMACVQTTVIDSDCAIMELYNEKGEQADMFVIGRADDYFGDNIPQPKESIWKPFLTEGSSWDEFNSIKNGDFVFVEDVLSELAPAIGMNSRNLVLEADEAVEDEQTLFLYFRKSDAKKEKKLALNAAFKQVFGEALEPLGFKLLKKTKTPVLARCINDEIIHVITYRKLGVMKTGYNRYEVSCGAISLYRRNIDLNDSPENWLTHMARYYYVYNNSVSKKLKLELIRFRYDIWGRTYDEDLDESTLEEEFTRSLFELQCNANNNIEMLKGMRMTCEAFKEIALPVLDRIIDLDSYIEFCYEMTPKRLELTEIDEFISDERYNDSDGLILILADYRNDGKERYARMLEKGITALGRRKTLEKIVMLKMSYEKERAFQVAVRDNILDTPELKSKAINEAIRIQKANIEELKKNGLFQESKPYTETAKKLTLNAAFKQVFGEALEPFGFKKIKSKYLYYVRMVGNEILHIITVNSRPDNRFEILGGIATIYRQALSLDKKPIDNKNWLLSNFQYYRLQQILNDGREYNLDDLYEFYGGDLLLSEMNRALNITQNIMLELFDKVDTLEKCIDFYNLFDIDIRIHHSDDFGNKYPVNFYNEGLLLLKTTNFEQYNRLIDKYNEKILKIREYEISNGVWDKEKYTVFVSEQKEYKSKQLGIYKSFLEDKDWFDGVARELEKRKEYNVSLLQQYGL